MGKLIFNFEDEIFKMSRTVGGMIGCESTLKEQVK